MLADQEGANARALALGHTTIDPAHLLLAVLDAGRRRRRRVGQGGRRREADAALALVLRMNGAFDRLLREHGIDAQRLREAFGPDPDAPIRG